MDELKSNQGGYGIKELIYLDLAHPTADVIGKTLGTLLDFCTLFRLPIQFVNDKVKFNMSKRLNEYTAKLDEVSEDKRCKVPMEVGMPILEKLPYTTNDEIADMFTTLLASASNVDTANVAHPSFADIIGHLSVDEARIIKYMQGKSKIPYCDFRGKYADKKGFINIKEHVTLVPHEVNLYYPHNINAYLENLISQGILSDANVIYMTDDTPYENIKRKNGYEDLKAQCVPSVFNDIEVHKGYYQVTNLGKLFIKACIK